MHLEWCFFILSSFDKITNSKQKMNRRDMCKLLYCFKFPSKVIFIIT